MCERRPLKTLFCKIALPTKTEHDGSGGLVKIAEHNDSLVAVSNKTYRIQRETTER